MAGAPHPPDGRPSTARWRRVDALFHAAVDIAPPDRPAFLQQACGDDAALMADVASLLEADAQATSGFEPLASVALARLAAAATAVEEREEPSLVGRTLSHYEVIGLIGRGGMGVVYRARDVVLLREVALKILPWSTASDQAALARFTLEARAASALHHPGVAAVHELGDADGQPFIAMEYVDGCTLDDRLAGGPLHIDEAIDYAIHVADALEAAHEAGIVHRDVKPGNVMVTRGGVVKVLDFGIAKLRPAVDAGATTAGATLTGMVVGTIDYMSPEQALALAVDHRSDIFSLGVVLYQLVTGLLPFRRHSVTASLDALLHADVEPPSRVAGRAWPALDRVLSRALGKKPARRYQRAAEFATDLRALRNAVDPPGAPRRRRRPAARVAGRGVGLAAALLAVAWLWSSRGSVGVALPATRTVPPAATIVPFTRYAGSESSPAWSPDGQWLAFVWDGPDRTNPDVYVQALGGEPLRLTTDPAVDEAPVFSPDGQRVAFVRDASRAMVVGRDGSGARDVGRVAHPRMTFTPDGRALVVGAASDGGGLEAIALDGGGRQVLTRPPAGSIDVAPAFSPDGTRLAFLRQPGPGVADIWVATASGAGPTRLTFDDRPVDGPVWTRDGHALLFGSTRFGARRLWRIDADGQRLEPLPDTGPGATQPAVAPHADRLAFVSTVEDSNLWEVTLDDAGAPLGPPRPCVAQSSLLDGSPDFAPDGVHIAFASNRSGRDEIYYGSIDSVTARQVTDFSSQPTGGVGSPRISPDGTRIAFDARVRGNADIYVVPVTGGRVTRLTTDESMDAVPVWSDDGAWIYFTSRRSGRPEIWRIPAGGGPEEQVTWQGAFGAQVSADGRSLIYARDRDRSTLYRQPIGGGAEEPVLVDADGRTRYVVMFAAWRPTRHGVVFIEQVIGDARRGDGYLLQAYDAASRAVRTLGQLTAPPAQASGGLAIAPDGRRILFTQMDQQRSDISLLEPFR